MAKKNNRKKGDEVKLEMTPMIDVVFQLLIFFIVTLKQEDIYSQLEVLRPAPDPNANPETQPEPVKILIGRTGFVYAGRPVTEAQLEESISRVARKSRQRTIMLQCTGDSDHKWLVRALDICNKYELKQLAVFSM